MSFISTVSPKDAVGDVHDMYARQQSSWGFVPNYAKVFCHRPAVMGKWAQLLAEIRRPMSDRFFELATFATAIEMKHSYCSLAHGQQLAAMIDAEDVRELAGGGLPANLTDGEKEVVRFAKKVAKDASSINAEDVEPLKDAGYSDDQIFDIAITVAARTFLTKVSDALGVEPDSSFRSMGPEMCQSLAVGRSISQRKVEKV